MEKSSGQTVRSVIDVPFSRGTLALNYHEADAYSPTQQQQLAESAESLTIDFERQSDLEQVRTSELRYRTLVETPYAGHMLLDEDG
jgi:hypothetical protein